MRTPKNPTSTDVFLMLAAQAQESAAGQHKLAARYMEIATNPGEAEAIIARHEEERLAHNKELALRRKAKRAA